MKSQANNQEITIELSSAIVNRLNAKRKFLKNSTAEEAVRMIRYALRRMFPPRTRDEWRGFVKKEDWKELWAVFYKHIVCHVVRKLTGRASEEGYDKSDLPAIDQPQQIRLELSADLMNGVEEIARIRNISTVEAAVYAIEYALTEIFPPKTKQELDRDIRQTWGELRREIRNR